MGTPAQEEGKLKSYRATVFLIEFNGSRVRGVLDDDGCVRIDSYVNRRWKKSNRCATVLGAWVMVTQRITDQFRNTK